MKSGTGMRLGGLSKPELDIRLTYPSKRVFLLHISDASASRWIELTPEDADLLATGIKAKLAGGPDR